MCEGKKEGGRDAGKDGWMDKGKEGLNTNRIYLELAAKVLLFSVTIRKT